ncbi:MAG: hypothetical protein R3318_06380, partial [Gammaproteobacteria bacterium]|nr:hypothetical protein [Gammaproteobacteria bacterium]
EDNFWIRAGYPDGTTHPHLQALEIACETGVIGLTAFVLFYLLLLRFTCRQARATGLRTLPWMLAPLTAFFPLNAHLAFYGTYWSSVSWWSLALALAACYSSQDAEDTGT